MKSIWQAGTPLPRFAPLDRDVRTKVLVIGGGMAGLLCTYLLCRAGIDTLLVEADTLCGGVTGHTTAKLTAQHGLCYDRLLRQGGEKLAGGYLNANLTALQCYEALCRDIDCGFSKQDAYVYSLTDKSALHREAAALRRLGVTAEVTGADVLPFPVAGAVRFPNQAQFDPLRFAAALAEGLPIREHTPVLDLQGKTAVTPGGRIRAEQIVVTTHFPFLNRHGSYFVKLYQSRSYVLALQGASPVDGMYVDESDTGLSFRMAGDLLLLGGSGHRTGKPTGGWQTLRTAAARFYPGAREVARWAAQDCMPLDGIPYIGQYSARTPGLYVATGFQKWGMTSSMVAALLLRDLIAGKDNPYAALFSPSRSILCPQLGRNLLSSAAGLLTPTRPRCPHLGCALHWNPAEHSWDCSCHGSRFSETGQLLDNPANGSLKKPPGGASSARTKKGRPA